MKKVMFFPFISIFASVYSYLVVRFYYFNLMSRGCWTLNCGSDRTPKERFFDNVKGLSPIVFLIILLIGACFYGKHHFEKWGWKERCGVFLFAVLGIALFMLWIKFY